MPIYVYPATSRLELEVFRGSKESAASLGFTQRQFRERPATDVGSPWLPALGTTWRDARGREATKGDVYARQVTVDAEDELHHGEFIYVGPSIGEHLKKFGKAVNIAWEPRVAPGENMRTPLGSVMFDSEGDIIVRPQVGEQDLDPWTGDPMVDDDGNPVLVQ